LQTPGRVWAADFTEPSWYGTAQSLPPIAGLYPYVLAVRDLASGCQQHKDGSWSEPQLA
jgi:hypothetical protein